MGREGGGGKGEGGRGGRGNLVEGAHLLLVHGLNTPPTFDANRRKDLVSRDSQNNGASERGAWGRHHGDLKGGGRRWGRGGLAWR